MLILSVILVFLSFTFGLVPKEIADFFNRSGFVVKKTNGSVFLDLGRGKVFPGEKFVVERRGKEIVHPITKKVIGYETEQTGKVKVVRVEDSYSLAKILEDKGIKEGDRVKLFVDSVCFVGSEEGFYSLSEFIPNLKRGEDCPYVIKEMKGGYGLSFLGKPLAFFERAVGEIPKKGVYFEDFVLKAKFVRTLEGIPLGADICKLFGRDKDYLVVLFSDYLKVYEIVKSDFVEVIKYSLPPGEPVGVQCFIPEEGKPGILFVNIVSGGTASSAVLKPVGNSLVIIEKNIPYIFTILDKENQRETLLGQEFTEKELWGEVYHFHYKNGEIVRGEKADFPEDFRVDGAAKKGDILVFVDSLTRLRVYVGNKEVITEDGFGPSYTTASIPGIYDYDEGKYSFFVKPSFTKVLRNIVPLIPRNKTSGIFEIVGFTKFTHGEIWTVVRKGEDYFEPIKIRGRKFEEAIQAILKDSEGRIFVITGTKGTLPLQNRGDIFIVEINPL